MTYEKGFNFREISIDEHVFSRCICFGRKPLGTDDIVYQITAWNNIILFHYLKIESADKISSWFSTTRIFMQGFGDIMLDHFKIHILAHINISNHIFTGEVAQRKKRHYFCTSCCILHILFDFPFDFRGNWLTSILNKISWKVISVSQKRLISPPFPLPLLQKL